MRNLSLSIILVVLGYAVCYAEPPVPAYKTGKLSDKFYAEGAYYADFNRDGKLDVVAGPYWYEGPNFQKRHEIRLPKAFDPKDYSDNFLTYTGDFNNDGWPDILCIPSPGGEAYWYENPAGKDVHWMRHLALKDVGNESPVWVDVNGNGRPELVYNTTGYLGYATYDPAKPDEPWVFHAVTPKDKRYFCYTHGIGAGDINGDGRIDLAEAAGWWEQPANAQPDQPWIWHPMKFAEAGAQMLVYDVDGDGLNDVITVWQCHGYGLLWYKQLRGRSGEITWQQHAILPPKPDLKSDGLRISQMHAMDLADFNGDGLKDIVTGKRFWAHGPKGDAEPNAPAVLYWFELRRDKQHGVQFVPHQIDADSGVGTQVAAVDLNDDGIPDVLVSNKKGTFVHLSQSAKAMAEDAKAARAVIDKALAAAGGAGKLAKFAGGTWEGRGTYLAFGNVAFTIKGARQGPDQASITTSSQYSGGSFTYVLVVDRDRGWVKVNGQTRELTGESLAEEKERLYSKWVATLTPLGGRQFRLSLLGESTAGGQAVVGVEVISEGHRPVRLYFDQKTGLLARTETRIKDLQQQGKHYQEVLAFSDYKPVDGALHASKVKVVKDGKLIAETEILKNRPAEKLPDSEFAKP